MQHFSVAWEEKVIFLLVFLQLSVKNKEKSLCQTARSFTTHCRHLCSSASLQFDAVMCQTAVSSEDTSMGLHSPTLSQACHFSSEGATRGREIYEVFV